MIRSFRNISVLLVAGLLSSPVWAENENDWSYDGDQNGQEEWGAITPRYAACEIGKAQSPIIVAETKVTDLSTLDFRYHPSDTAHGRNTGRIALVSFDDQDQVLMYNKMEYHLKHIVIHSPAEHITKGRAHVAEIQFMHLGPDNKKLIIALFADPGNSPPGPLQKILDHLPAAGKADTSFSVNPAKLIPQERGYYTYMGSLTTPPCTEDVEWVLLKRKIGITQNQLRQVGKLINRNARVTQPVYFRTVKETADY